MGYRIVKGVSERCIARLLLTQGKHNFIAKSINKFKTHPIIKTKGKITLKSESISIVEVKAPWDMLKWSILNTSTNYERGTLLGTFEPVDKEINEIQTTIWTQL